MNLNTIAALINDDITTVKCLMFQKSDYAKENNSKPYTFKVRRALANVLMQGDLVLCEIRDKIQILTVIEVDEVAELDPESNIEYKWCFQKVESEMLDKLKFEECEVAHKLRSRRKHAIRKQALEALGFTDEDVKVTLKTPGEAHPRKNLYTVVEEMQAEVDESIKHKKEGYRD